MCLFFKKKNLVLLKTLNWQGLGPSTRPVQVLYQWCWECERARVNIELWSSWVIWTWIIVIDYINITMVHLLARPVQVLYQWWWQCERAVLYQWWWQCERARVNIELWSSWVIWTWILLIDYINTTTSFDLSPQFEYLYSPND